MAVVSLAGSFAKKSSTKSFYLLFVLERNVFCRWKKRISKMVWDYLVLRFIRFFLWWQRISLAIKLPFFLSLSFPVNNSEKKIKFFVLFVLLVFSCICFPALTKKNTFYHIYLFIPKRHKNILKFLIIFAFV